MLSSNFIEYFGRLEDPRVTNHNTRHKFIDILVMGFIATLCGCDDWEEIVDFCEEKGGMFSQFLELPNGIPSHDTFSRVFSMIDVEHFEEIFSEWMQEIFRKTDSDIIAIDGKTIRAAREKGQRKGIHIVHAWACHNKLSLGSVRVDDKSNEITAVPKLLKLLDITDCIVTLDAMHCQKSIAEAIINKGANYVLCVKDNQKGLRSSISTAFKILEQRPFKEYEDSGAQVEKGHGRIESRQYLTLPLTYLPYLKEEWPGIQSVAKVMRTRIIDGQESHEERYYISSLEYTSKKIDKAVRNHWGIENRLHWQLDVSFNEDKSRARIKNAAQCLNLMRKISMAYLKKDPDKAGIKRKRKRASYAHSYLFDILTKACSESEPACEP